VLLDRRHVSQARDSIMILESLLRFSQHRFLPCASREAPSLKLFPPEETSAHMKKTQRIAAAGVALAVGISGFAALEWNSSAVSGASTLTSVLANVAADTTTPPATKAAWVADALKPLVTDGTISQEQADKIIAALKAAAPVRGNRPAGLAPRGPGFGRGFAAINLDSIAKLLNIPVADLKKDLAGGQTIADIATTQKVDIDTVIAALVADATTAAQKAVTDGKATQAQVDAQLPNLKTRITDIVNGKAPFGGKRMRGGMGGGFGGPGFAGPQPGATTTTTSTN
jgi:hypothetical protein